MRSVLMDGETRGSDLRRMSFQANCVDEATCRWIAAGLKDPIREIVREVMAAEFHDLSRKLVQSVGDVMESQRMGLASSTSGHADGSVCTVVKAQIPNISCLPIAVKKKTRTKAQKKEEQKAALQSAFVPWDRQRTNTAPDITLPAQFSSGRSDDEDSHVSWSSEQGAVKLRGVRDLQDDLASRILSQAHVKKGPGAERHRRASIGMGMATTPSEANPSSMQSGPSRRLDMSSLARPGNSYRTSTQSSEILPEDVGSPASLVPIEGNCESPVSNLETQMSLPAQVLEADSARLSADPVGAEDVVDSQNSGAVVSPKSTKSGRIRGHLMTSQVMERRVNQLVDVIPCEVPESGAFGSEDEPEQADRLERVLMVVFRAGGLLSWEGSRASTRFPVVYKSLVVFLLGILLSWTIVDVVSARSGVCVHASTHTGCDERRLFTEVLVAGAIFAFVAVLGLFRGSHRLDDLMAMLQGYAYNHDLQDLWRGEVRQDVAFMVGMCALGIGMHIGEVYRFHSSWDVKTLLRVAINISVMLWSTICLTFLSYVVRVLIITVDVFSYECVQDPNVPKATDSWNLLQALLRKASTTVERGLLMLLGLAACTVPAILLDNLALGSYIETVRVQLPHILIMCGVLRIFVIAAAVTDKCLRVPALINTLTFGEGADRERLHLVEYIVHSAAGFYVCDVRLTLGMVTKFTYIWFVILSGFVGNELTRM
mmetsp:Transcript_129108/g.373667  ORF Transcript_129108/g.373667 Transcript_129108/m.373667 type:complete len:712 (-) Transcript_129108:149-2284(-)